MANSNIFKVSLLIGLCTVIVVLAAFFASGSPDGLEFVGEKLDFLKDSPAFYAIFPDYSVPAIKNNHLSTILSGMAGIGICLGLVLFVKLLIPKEK